MKKVLDVTTKGWKEEDINRMKGKLIAQGMKYQVEILLINGKTKWAYCREPKGEDVAQLCKQLGAKIVKVEPFP